MNIDTVKNEFDSEFCNVNYMSEDNIVVLTWKKFCCYDDYRNPATFALELLEKYSNSNFVVDARNGFEDEKEDVAWVFNEFIPQMAKTDCKKIVFIINQMNDLNDEIDMFTCEFMKYFEVNKVLSFEEATNISTKAIYDTKLKR